MMRPATHVRALRAVLLSAIVTASAGSACGGDDDCDFDAVLREVGGVGLIDCRIANVDDTSDVDACAVEAQRANQTFRAIYEQEDGELRAIVHAAGDTYHVVTLSSDGRTIARAECADGVLVQEAGRSHVECIDPEPFRTVCE